MGSVDAVRWEVLPGVGAEIGVGDCGIGSAGVGWWILQSGEGNGSTAVCGLVPVAEFGVAGVVAICAQDEAVALISA